MKKTIIALVCALAAPLAFAQTSTTTTEETTNTTKPETTTQTTTSTTYATGTVTTYQPGKTIVVRSEQGPVSFALGTAARIVDTAGKVVTAPLRPGAPALSADPLIAIVARVSGRPANGIRDDMDLGAGLGLESLGRVELLSAIEEELGRVLDELAVGPQTTVADLRRLVGAGAVEEAAEPGPR